MNTATELVKKTLEHNKNMEMVASTKSDAVETRRYINEIKKFEDDRIKLKNTLIKIGFSVAGVFGLVSALLAIAITTMMPLKKETLAVMLLDRLTGRMEILRPMADARETTYGEVLDRHWLKVFINNRNGYDWDLVQHNFNVVKLMSDPEVFGEYQSYITGPQSPVKNYEDDRVVKVSNVHVAFLPDFADKRIAQINFQRDVLSSSGQTIPGYKPTIWTATVTFDYLSEISTDDERDLNPLAFRITSYVEDRVID